MSVTGSVKPADGSLLTYLVCRTFAKTGNSGEREAGLIPSICPQTEKPVVNTSVEKLAQDLEGLARSQVRREQGPRRAGRSQGEAVLWEGVRVVGLGRGRGHRQGIEAPTSEAPHPQQG